MDQKSQTNPGPPPLHAALPAFLIAAAIPGMIKLASQIVAWRLTGHTAALGDGVNDWAGPYLARQNVALVFSPPAYSAWVAAHLARPHLNFSYPPSLLLLLYPLGFLRPVAAVFLFDAASLLVLAMALASTSFLKKSSKKLLFPAGSDDSPAPPPGNRKFFASFFQKRRSSFLPILLCPAALENLADSQNGALISALLIAGLTWESERPLAAGILLGLLSVKPQIAVLAPVYLLARGNRRALAAAALTALILAGLSAAAFGLGPWRQFAVVVSPMMSAGLAYMTHTPHPGPQPMLMSVFSLCREFRASVTAASAAQAASAALAVLLAWRFARAGTALSLPAMLLLTALATPYLWCYDMIFCAYATACLAAPALADPRPLELAVLAGLWVTPGLAVYLDILHLPSLFPLFAAAALALAWRRQATAPPAPALARA